MKIKLSPKVKFFGLVLLVTFISVFLFCLIFSFQNSWTLIGIERYKIAAIFSLIVCIFELFVFGVIFYFFKDHIVLRYGNSKFIFWLVFNLLLVLNLMLMSMMSFADLSCISYFIGIFIIILIVFVFILVFRFLKKHGKNLFLAKVLMFSFLVHFLIIFSIIYWPVIKILV